ncbi:hypothetical protein PENSTE_c024G06506 [Penicillium steckii]|uniref:Uncharacterized protein n=1 Tax=Penicillium steckii TaxID=303698 RepID=A0A1V6SQS7_9EURO|nr:hypothetical protein PENSTE_c024G06506 [Penicillium steckii]
MQGLAEFTEILRYEWSLLGPGIAMDRAMVVDAEVN